MNKSTFSKLSRLNNVVVIVFLLIVVASCNNESGNKQSQPSNADLLSAANELDSLFLVAFNNGDAEAIMKLHWNSPDLRVYPPGEMQVNGYEAVKAGYIRDFADSKGARLEYTNANNIPFADGVVGFGTFRWTMPMEGSEQMVFDGRYTEVKAMRDGKMVIIIDHTSMPMPPPPADSTQSK